MSRHPRWASAGALVVGVIVGGVVALSVDRFLGAPQGPAPVSLPEPVSVVTPPSETFRSGASLVAWAPGGLPRTALGTAARTRGVEAVTEVVGMARWLTESRAADGSLIERAATGYRIPFDVAYVSPKAMGALVDPAEGADITALEKGGAVLSETSSELRGVGVGGSLRLDDDEVVSVVAVVDDETASGYEALLPGPPPRGHRHYPFLLVRVEDEKARHHLERRLERILPAGQVMRVRSQGETPYLRYGDAVLPDLMIKETFGEFHVVEGDSGLSVDPEWLGANIRTVTVPILGSVTCHRAFLPQLEDALEEIEASGLAHAIDPGDYGGCFSSRFIGGAKEGRLSHHSWGVAVDIDVSENAFGTKPDQDPRIIEIMERHGLSWGGRWLIPDGMHFEWTHFP